MSRPNEGAKPHASEAAERTRIPSPKTSVGLRRASQAAGSAAESEREVERGENPGERRDLDVVASENVRQRDRDDRRVGKDDAYRNGKQHDWGAHFSDETSVRRRLDEARHTEHAPAEAGLRRTAEGTPVRGTPRIDTISGRSRIAA